MRFNSVRPRRHSSRAPAAPVSNFPRRFMKHFTQTPGRRNTRVFIATLLSYLMLVGQVTPLALASNNSVRLVAPAAKAEAPAPGEVQETRAAPKPAPLSPVVAG